MIKLKKLLELDEIKYSGKIKPKHKKRMEKELKLTHEVQVRHNPPPLNSSRETRKELEWLKNYNEGQVDEDMVKKGDNVKTAFREYCEENFLDYPKNYIKELIKESGKIIYQLKYKYNRPRPKQVAEFLEMDFPTTTLESMHTPSYPSGHSTQGIFIGRVLSKMYPKHEKQLMEIGKMISNSRLMARAHYPSDSKFGEELGELLFRNLK
jgi:acid phosphatase (class A)